MTRISIASVRQRLAGAPGAASNPRLAARLVLAVLVAANLIAAVLVFRPWEGSADSLEKRAQSLRLELKRKQVQVERLRGLVGKVQTARTEGDTFMASNLLNRRTVSSNLLGELDQLARTAGIKQKEVTFSFEPVEGSEALSRAEIVANYDGAYGDLMHFLNLLDHSQRLLIVDSLAATPQPQGQLLGITLKLNAFVSEGAASEDQQPSAAPASAAAGPAAGEPASVGPQPAPAGRFAPGQPPAGAVPAAPASAGGASAGPPFPRRGTAELPGRAQ
jgi:Tfp pilus assembly protein PilO